MYLYLVLEDCVWIFLKEHVIDGHVKRRYYFLGVCYQLTVEVGIELTQMLAVEVEKRLADDTYLCTNDTYLCMLQPTILIYAHYTQQYLAMHQ